MIVWQTMAKRTWPKLITNRDVTLFNKVLGDGILLLPPPGTVLRYCPERSPDAGWEFRVFRWEFGLIVLGDRGEFPGVVGLVVVSIASQGVHALSLDMLEQCELVEIPSEVPQFTVWPYLYAVPGFEQTYVALMGMS